MPSAWNDSTARHLRPEGYAGSNARISFRRWECRRKQKYWPQAKQIIALLRRTDPTDSLAYRWVERLAFNVSINNVDAHAKNYSVLLNNDRVRLAPMYDAMTTTYWDWVEPRLAMTIGGIRFALEVPPLGTGNFWPGKPDWTRNVSPASHAS